jgi:hypothetical protein
LVVKPTYDGWMAKSPLNIQSLAVLGAKQRLLELDEERAAIFSAFPQLRFQRKQQTTTGATADNGTTGARKRRRMSADARRRISEAVKARWAKQRAEKAGKQQAAKKGAAKTRPSA